VLSKCLDVLFVNVLLDVAVGGVEQGTLAIPITTSSIREIY
jgi:hypothetical protein